MPFLPLCAELKPAGLRGIILGSLLFTLFTPSADLDWHWHIVAAVNNTLQPLMGLWLLRRIGFINARARIKDVGAFIGLGAVATALFGVRGEVWVKGKGNLRTYFLRQKSPVVPAKSA